MTANPADAVREAPTELDRIIAEMRDYSAGPDCDSRIIDGWADRLAALAGAAPVGWMRRSVTYWGAEGRTDGERIMSERKVYDDDVPLYAHAPAKAREDDAKDAARWRVVRAGHQFSVFRNGMEWLEELTDDQADAAVDAALATFAEGEE